MQYGKETNHHVPKFKNNMKSSHHGNGTYHVLLPAQTRPPSLLLLTSQILMAPSLAGILIPAVAGEELNSKVQEGGMPLSIQAIFPFPLTQLPTDGW